MYTLEICLALLALLLSLDRFLRAVRQKNSLPFPPGPPSDPFIGHLRVIPRGYNEAVYNEWRRKYGDVVYLNVLGKTIIMLNSEKAAVDLLDKRSASYSDRPSVPMYDLLGVSDVLGFLPYESEFHKMRKMIQQPFARRACGVFQEIQRKQCFSLLNNLTKEPQRFEEHIKRFSTMVILEIAYGQKDKDEQRYLDMAEEINQLFAGAGAAGSTPIDLLPLLRYLPSWFPGAWFIRYAEKYRSVAQRVKDYPFDEVTRQMADGNAPISFVSMHLEEMSRDGIDTAEERRRLKVSAFQLYIAGGKTTWLALECFILAMVLHPHVQQKAQAEIDRVIGRNRLPDFSDFEALPYINCVVQEVLRWQTPAPLGLPHSVRKDDEYRGMRIPRGSVIIANNRCMTMDENVYDEPHIFRPERFLPQSIGDEEPHPQCVFGFGRRICPGRHLAQGSVWIVAATILATFDIRPILDEQGQEVLPRLEFETAITSQIKPFQCQIRPRSDESRHLISQTNLALVE
ncbi:cytochrome P450 family protein [Abortiporus biennis]